MLTDYARYIGTGLAYAWAGVGVFFVVMTCTQALAEWYRQRQYRQHRQQVQHSRQQWEEEHTWTRKS